MCSSDLGIYVDISRWRNSDNGSIEQVIPGGNIGSGVDGYVDSRAKRKPMVICIAALPGMLDPW